MTVTIDNTLSSWNPSILSPPNLVVLLDFESSTVWLECNSSELRCLSEFVARFLFFC
jgi:hypothetical protein